jgi:hypothetical protein
LRAQIEGLYEQWKSGIPISIPERMSPSSLRVEKIGRAGPGLIRNIREPSREEDLREAR